MFILYAFLIVLLVHPAIGTVLFALVEKLGTSTKIKIVILSFGHPFLSAIIIWVVCSAFNKDIAETGVLLIAGSLLQIPFSSRKYFSGIVKKTGVVTIEYYSAVLKRKTISLPISEIIDLTQSTSRNLIDKPSELTVTLSNQILEFDILDNTTRVNL